MSVLQKFQKFALTKEQGNVIKGGEWVSCYDIKGGRFVDIFQGTNGNLYTIKDRVSKQVSNQEYVKCY